MSTFAGGISNSGVISGGEHGILIRPTGGGAVAAIDTFTGGISNAGTVTAALDAAIYIKGVTNFGGGIDNARGGVIGAKSADAIDLTSLGVFGNSGSGGGISNAGIISGHATGIFIRNVSTFAGGIVNASGGVIDGKGDQGIELSSVGVFGNAGAGGGINNAGTISANFEAIEVRSVSALSGGIVNSAGGTISGGYIGINVRGASLFSGDVLNSGSIRGSAVGIALLVSTFQGDVSNAGTIFSSDGNAVAVEATTFAGNIVNSGKLVASGRGLGLGFAPSENKAALGTSTAVSSIKAP